jgi:hypothetical protein
LNYIAWFISHLTLTCEPIFQLLQKKNLKEWNKECNKECQETFDKIK